MTDNKMIDDSPAALTRKHRKPKANDKRVLLILILGGALLAPIFNSSLRDYQHVDTIELQTARGTTRTSSSLHQDEEENKAMTKLNMKSEPAFETRNQTQTVILSNTNQQPNTPPPLSSSDNNQTTNQELLSSTSNACFLQNSREWLQSIRRGNINMTQEEWTMQQELSSSPLLHHIDALLGQTLAWSNSRLVQSSLDIHDDDDDDDDDDPTTEYRWLTRLSFALIHHHQHGPARTEWQSTPDECMEKRRQQGFGRWDWECPDQKYILFSQQDQGIGAGVDLFRQALMEGISSRRVVLDMNKIPGIARAWSMASCPRRDMQCVFAPVSPCVLTMDQIYNGTSFNGQGAYSELFRKGEPPAEYGNPKVVWQSYAHFGIGFQNNGDLFFQRLYDLSQELLDELPTDDAIRPVWERTAKMFLHNQTLALDSFEKAINMYMLRPNPHYREELREMLTSNIPQDDYDPQKTIGLPIRATDKCKKESSCLSFERYMELAMYTWKESLPNEDKPHVIVTSESKEIYSRLRDVMADPEQSARYPLRFVLNDGDVQPGSGRFREGKANVTADDGMVSAMSTLQLQLGSGVVRANCCSRFHRLMGDFLSVGAGATVETDFQCLDKFGDPRFRICCWKKAGCLNQRNNAIEQLDQLEDGLEPEGMDDSANEEAPTGACLFENSAEWRHSKRLGNINMTREDWIEQHELSSSPLLYHIDGLMGQTLAWPNSRLVQSEQDIDDPTADLRWLTRMAFATIYHHQHRPARLQWKSTTSITDECMESRIQEGMGRWDWECPNQKFLAFSQQDQGMGAGVNLFRQAILAGISSQRIVLPINHIGTMGKAWTMASCPRRDMQCVFAPISPCVLTMDQIYNGTFLQNKGGLYSLFHKGGPPAEYNNARVLWQGYANFGLNDPERENRIFFQRVYNISQELLDEIPVGDPTRSVWERTAEMFLNNQAVALECFQKAITMYMLRPNPYYRTRLSEMLKSNVPSDDFDPQKTIGLPIRATDKCKKESTCLSFDDYMELVLETWKEALPDEPKPHVIVTSESKEIYKKLRDLIDDPEQSPRYPFRFVMNDEDSQPGSGRFRTKADNITADEGMVAALSTLQLQLGSGVVRANCCSKFHTIMGEFLSVGGGGALENDFQCLHQIEDPRFRICCFKSGGCLNRRNQDLVKWKELHGASNVTARV
jgi:hypothetical protein